ncbi:hypothetical protein ABZ322_37410, partial [Streptomyces sp. NPDC006129]
MGTQWPRARVAPYGTPGSGQGTRRRRQDTAAPGTAEVRMRRTDPVGHGPVRFGPPLPEDGLPVLPELSAVLALGERGPEPDGAASTTARKIDRCVAVTTSTAS